MGWASRRAFVFSVLTFALAGCVVPVAPIAKDALLSAEQGAVVFKMVVNAGSAHPASRMEIVVLAKEDPGNGNDRVLLLRTERATHDAAVYSGVVSPGRYRVSHATNTVTPAAGQAVYTFPLGSINGSFDVKAGEVSLLGTLLVQPGEGNRYRFHYLAPEEELKESFESLFPALAEQARGRPFHSFTAAPVLQADSKGATDFKKLAVVANAPWQASDGGIYVGGKMGKARWRKAGDSRWREADSQSWRSVTSLRPYRQGLVAAGEEGLLRHSADDGRTWRALAPPDQGLIAALEPFPGGRSIAVTRLDAEWRVYASDDLLAGRWQKLDEVKLPKGVSSNFVFRLGDRLGVMSVDGRIVFVDAQILRVERVEGAPTVWGASATAGGLLVKEGMRFARTHSVSEDGGKSWQELKLGPYVDTVAAKDRKTLYAANPRRLGGLLFSADAALQVSRDGGLTWTATAWPPGMSAIRHLLVDQVDGSVLAWADDGRLVRSKDEGATWSQEF